MNARRSNRHPGRRRGRFRRQAWLLAGLAAVIYLGYVVFLIVRGTGGS